MQNPKAFQRMFINMSKEDIMVWANQNREDLASPPQSRAGRFARDAGIGAKDCDASQGHFRDHRAKQIHRRRAWWCRSRRIGEVVAAADRTGGGRPGEEQRRLCYPSRRRHRRRPDLCSRFGAGERRRLACAGKNRRGANWTKNCASKSRRGRTRFKRRAATKNAAKAKAKAATAAVFNPPWPGISSGWILSLTRCATC